MAGNTQQFTATGTYSDSSTQNLTSQATWNSSNTTRATINTNGLATGVTAGTTTISATLSGVSGNTLLTVQPAPPTVAITSPANNSTVGTNFTIIATATDSDGTVTNVSFYDGAHLARQRHQQSLQLRLERRATGRPCAEGRGPGQQRPGNHVRRGQRHGHRAERGDHHGNV